MKKVLVVTAITAALFNGCATDGVYEVGKSVYKGGKLVVEENDDLLSKGTLKTLKSVDRVATGYDTIRTEVRTDLKKKPLHVDTNYMKTE